MIPPRLRRLLASIRIPAAVLAAAGLIASAGLIFPAQVETLLGFAGVVAGAALLITGADAMVKGAVRLAKVVGLSPFFIGLTVVAFGTSAPELAASIGATLKGQGPIAVGNVIGSNIANICLILGVTAMIRSIRVDPGIVRHDYPLVIIASFLASIPLLDGFFERGAGGVITEGLVTRFDGIVLVAGLVAYVAYNARSGCIDPAEIEHEVEMELGDAARTLRRDTKTIAFSLVLILIGLAALVLGAELLVSGAERIAMAFGVPEIVIGITIVAIGTSVPELAFSARAATQNHAELALGNVLGSNVFNMLSVMGIAGLVDPVRVPVEAGARDIWLMLLITAIAWPLMWTRGSISRLEGGVLLVIYAVYIGFIVTGS